MTPNIKTTLSHIRAHRRPRRSARGALPNAPRKVPADRIETINDCCEGETLSWPVESIYPVEKWSFQYLANDQLNATEGRSKNSYLIAKIPLIVPVSYPKRIPPKETKTPTAMAGNAEPGTSAGC